MSFTQVFNNCPWLQSRLRPYTWSCEPIMCLGCDINTTLLVSWEPPHSRQHAVHNVVFTSELFISIHRSHLVGGPAWVPELLTAHVFSLMTWHEGSELISWTLEPSELWVSWADPTRPWQRRKDSSTEARAGPWSWAQPDVTIESQEEPVGLRFSVNIVTPAPYWQK